MAIDWEAYKKKAKKLDEANYPTKKSIYDIASSRKTALSVPVKSTTPAPKKKKRTWFQDSEYFADDSWDKGDLLKTIFGSATDVGENATAGAMGSGEKFLDALAMIGNALYGSQMSQAAENEMIFNTLAGKSNENTLKNYTDLQKQAKKGTEEFVKKDLYDEEAIAKKIISAPIKEKTGIDAETASVFGEKSDAVAQSAGQLAATKALSLAGVPWFLTTGGTAFGGQAEQALNEGATYEQAMMSATVSAGAEVLSEKLTGGIKFGSKTLDEAVTKPLIETISNKAVQKLVNIGVDAVGEGSEEVISSFFSRLGTALYKEEDLSEILASEEAFDEYLEGFIGGAFLGGASSTGKAVKGKVKGFDPVSELTDNEQKVVDKIVSDRITEKTKDGNKLTTRDKIKVREAVKTDMEKGRIDIDTLESILGGETYNKYKSLSDKETSLQSEYDKLYKMKRGDMTNEQVDRLENLKKELETFKSSDKDALKAQLSKDVFNLAKDSRLVESYNEKARKSKAFEADLSKYDAAQQETIKKAVDSGILNNTNRTHEFVDMLAKISADKGVSFDFTNNEKLKNSSFALEGKTVNGYVTGDGNVAVNIDSAKSLNSVVGHEITHILEGTELYDALQQSIVEYAKAKGDYQGRYDALVKLYEGIEGADINKELTADLVGDYLFTDENFIRSLSTEQPGVFKKVYDEIKYLCKVATAGSKEARELEKIKKTFSDIYRDSGKAQKNTTEEGGVKYSLQYETAEVNNNIISLIEKVKANDYKDNDFVNLGIVSDKAAKKIKEILGVDVSGYKISIEARQIKHILKGHGEHGLTDNSMAKATDIGKMEYAFTNFDNVVDGGRTEAYFEMKNGHNRTARTVLYEKEIGEKSYYVVQAVPETKRKTLFIVSAYIGENGQKKEAPRLINANSPDATSTTVASATSKDNIPQNSEKSSEIDNQYMDAVVRGDNETAQRLVDEAAKAHGYTIKAYHGTPHGGFTVFNEDKIGSNTDDGIYGSGFYFSTHENQAGQYGDIMPVYLNGGNTLSLNDVTPSELADMLNMWEGNFTIDNSTGIVRPVYSQVAQFTSHLKDAGYDSVYVDYGTSDEIVIFNSERIKSADPVTYDDNGNVIPLSQRFNEDNNDTRYSLSSEDAQPVKHGDYNVTGDDVRYIAPTDVGVAKNTTTTLGDLPIRTDIAKKSQNKAQKEQVLSKAPPLRKDIAAENATNVAHGEEVDVPVAEDITEEPVSITTVKERLEANLQNATTQLDNNKKLREESIDRFNAKIADYQSQYEAKKNKDTQVANNLLRSIERLKNNRDNVTAGYDKRINDIEKRIEKINVQLQQDHSKKDNLERALKRIDTRLEREKQELIDAYNLKKGKIEETTADKDAFVSKKAYELYRELRGLKKGVRASQELSAMLDYGPDWGELKRSLLHIKASPEKRVAEDSSVESIAREIIDSVYEDNLYAIDESNAELKKQLDELDAEAEKARQRARKEDAGSIRQKKQGQYEQEVSDLIGDTSTWQDKSLGISYQINTLHRNLRDVVRKEDGSRDIEKADRIYEYLQGSYNRNEAELKRESEKIKKPFIDMKINKYESEYTQMLGELRYYPGTTLTRDVTDAFYEQHKKQIDIDKVEKAITESRKVYDDLIQRVNAVLKEQGMKEIPYIKGYYPHFTKDKQGLLGKLLNWKTVNDDIPTDIAGLTEMFTPVRTYQSFNKHREARETDYDFSQGFDTYVHGALDWIYHIEDIQRRRAFENVIRYRHSEDWVKNRVDEIKSNVELDADESQELIDSLYKESKNPLGNFILDIRNSTNNLAGKKSTVDRTMEYATNRHVYSTMTNISNRVSANAVAGSISSALTNFIPITQSWGQVNPVYSLAAAKDAVRNALKDDGMIKKSTFMTNRLLEEQNLKKTAWDVAGEKLGLLMNVADHFTTEVVWRSKYLQNLQNGMSENDAIVNADIFAENVMAGRSRGNMPTIFNSKNPVTKTLTAFQLEVANQYGYMFKDMPQDIGEKNIKKLVSGYTKMFVGAYVYNVLFSALTGRDAAFDPIGIIVDLCKDLGLGPDDEEGEEPDVFGAVRNLGENVAQEIPFVGGLLGGGRIPISNALPYELKLGEFWDDIEGYMTSDNPETYKKRFIKEFTKPLYYLALPMGGGQLKKTVQGLKMFDDDLPIAGSYTDSGNLRFPVEDTPKNRVQAAIFGQYANENARKYFDEGYAPLKEKQIQEFIDVDIPIADYWKYREGLKGLETTEDKFDYVNGLNLPVSKKNILINNLVDRKEPVDLENYSDFSSLEEFDYSVKNPGKYAVSKVTGGYDSYKSYTKALSNIEGDTDNFGKTISGSRKQNVAKYINGLDADYYTKIILFKSEYNSDHRYDYEIVTHLNSRNDITYEEKVNILTELGFTVGPNGNISWE